MDGHVGYRVLPAPSVEMDNASETMKVVFVYCLACGVVVAHAPSDHLGNLPCRPAAL
jgi:hypothetical protein